MGDLQNKITGYEQRETELNISVEKLNELIAQLKQAEEGSAWLAAIINSSDDAIISKNLNSIVTSWNQSAERIFGYTSEEMIGQSIIKLIPEDRQDEEPKILARLKNGERVDHFETKRITKNRELIDVSLTISPVKDKEGNIIGLSKIARDITDKKQEEQRKNDFIALISHELKTPLTSIKSYVQMMLSKSRKDDDSFGLNLMVRAEAQILKMTDMIHDFLSLSKLESGKILYNKYNFDIVELIEEIVNDAQFITPNHTVKFIPSEQLHVYADRDKIGQVLINLLSNAVKYSPDGGNIIVGSETIEGKIKVYVSDEGVGISPQDQIQLFQRFYRVKNEKIKNISGFGIGLYLVSEILSDHDSKIKVQSEVGIGSTFHFTMNIVQNN